MKATTVRIEEDVLDRIDCLTKTLSQSKTWIIKQAIGKLLDSEEWFVTEVENGIKEIELSEIATDDEVTTSFNKWGVDAS